MVHAVYIFGTGSIEKYELDFFLSFCGLQIGLTPAETSYSTHTSPTIAPTLTLKSLSQPTKTLSTFSNCGPAQTVCYEYVPHSFFFNATVLEKVNAYKSTEKKKQTLTLRKYMHIPCTTGSSLWLELPFKEQCLKKTLLLAI